MIVALFILLDDHRISVLWLDVQSFIQFYFLYVRKHTLGQCFPKHVYSVVRSLSHRKELAENLRDFDLLRLQKIEFNLQKVGAKNGS